jgi:hypothetical protein
MEELLQQIDPDYYRSALLLMVRTEIARLRQGRTAVADVKRQSKITHSTPCSVDDSIKSQVPTAIAKSCSLESEVTD